jgi:hypothetical protein
LLLQAVTIIARHCVVFIVPLLICYSVVSMPLLRPVIARYYYRIVCSCPASLLCPVLLRRYRIVLVAIALLLHRFLVVIAPFAPSSKSGICAVTAEKNPRCLKFPPVFVGVYK